MDRPTSTVHRLPALDPQKGGLEVDQIVNADGLHNHAELRCRIPRLLRTEHHAWIGVVPEHSHARYAGDDLSEKLKPLRAQFSRQQRDARCVSARAGETRHNTGTKPDRRHPGRQEEWFWLRSARPTPPRCEDQARSPHRAAFRGSAALPPDRCQPERHPWTCARIRSGGPMSSKQSRRKPLGSRLDQSTSTRLARSPRPPGAILRPPLIHGRWLMIDGMVAGGRCWGEKQSSYYPRTNSETKKCRSGR